MGFPHLSHFFIVSCVQFAWFFMRSWGKNQGELEKGKTWMRLPLEIIKIIRERGMKLVLRLLLIILLLA